MFERQLLQPLCADVFVVAEDEANFTSKVALFGKVLGYKLHTYCTVYPMGSTWIGVLVGWY